MRRVQFQPRADGGNAARTSASPSTSIGGPYWDESVAWEFSLEQIETLEAASEDLHQRYLEAVDWVIGKRCFEPFAPDAPSS
jgi:glutathionylspermidine synthase